MNYSDTIKSGIKIINRAVLENRQLDRSELVIVDDSPITISLAAYFNLVNIDEYKLDVNPEVYRVVSQLGLMSSGYGIILLNSILSKMIVSTQWAGSKSAPSLDTSTIISKLKYQIEELAGIGYSVEALSKLGAFNYSTSIPTPQSLYPPMIPPTPYPSPDDSYPSMRRTPSITQTKSYSGYSRVPSPDYVIKSRSVNY
jgi:hypothetical protein